MEALVVAGLSSVIFVWSLFKIETPVRGIVFDFDVIEHAQNKFVGIHKVVFNNSESIPISCVHVLSRGTNKADIITRVAVPAPFQQDYILDKFGFCKPFETSKLLVGLRFICVVAIFVSVVAHLAYHEQENARKINVLPMRRSDPNIVLNSVSSETHADCNAKEV